MNQRFAEHGFAPVIDDNCTVLVLGSIPSVASAAEGFYNAHKSNRFWKILSAIFDEDFSVPKPQKIELLLKHRIALYDVLESCTIKGSADSTISDVVPADITKLIKGTRISKILITGNKAYNEFIKANPGLADMAYRLPSPSAANAAMILDSLIRIWAPYFKNDK